MPGELETYIDLFNDADKAHRTLSTALNDLTTKVGQVRKAPQLLSEQVSQWPTEEELRGLYQDVQKKTVPLQAAYNRLSEEYRKFAPNPANIGSNMAR